MPYFTKKPVTIEARRMFGPAESTARVTDWVIANGYPWLLGNALEPETLKPHGGKVGDAGVYIDPATGEFVIRTLEGDMRVSYGDWVIKGIKGEFYPCKPDIFDESYEVAA